jgi:RNA polymerase sigma-70 factor (sigma-E family)
LSEATTEPAGLRQFIEAESPALLRFAWALVGNWATAEDLVQTALVATWPRWESINQVERPEYYVRKVILTTFLRWRRRRWNQEIPTVELPRRLGQADDYSAVDSRQAVLAALMQLPPRQRAVVVLRYFTDLSEAQTAELLGCSIGTVKRHSHDALARLRVEPKLAVMLREGQSDD